MPVLRRNSLVTTSVVFLLVFTVLEGAIWVVTATGGLDSLMKLTARVAGQLTVFIGIPATVVGKDILLSRHTLRIDPDCTAIAIVALYSALVIAYPLSARTRALALLVGIPVILVANILRLIAVAVASEYLGQAAFAFAHDYLFKVVMILVVVALWATWLQIARGNAKTA
jgi:exosortase/archaeosortase family protein